MPAAGEAVRTVLYEPARLERAGEELPHRRQRLRRVSDRDRHPVADSRHRPGAAGDLRFLFLGCRFDDQMLRTYARQITKRSAGGHVAVVDMATLSRNEGRFLSEIGRRADRRRDAGRSDLIAEALA